MVYQLLSIDEVRGYHITVNDRLSAPALISFSGYRPGAYSSSGA